MRLSLLITLLIICAVFVNAQVPDWDWVNTVGGNGGESGSEIATDEDGNVFITGNFSSATINFGSTTLTNAGSTDFYIAKLDAAGNVLWANSAGGGLLEYGVALSTDNFGNVYVTGLFQSPTISFGNITLTKTGSGIYDIFLVKYDTNGSVVWAERIGGSDDDRVQDLSTDESGNVFICGSFVSPTLSIGNTTLLNSGSQDVFIAKYDEFGSPLWAKKSGGSDMDSGLSVSCDLNGNVFCSGNFKSSTISFGSITLSNPGGINNYEAFLVKFTPTGDVIWAKKAGGEFADNFSAIATDNIGNCYITGIFGSTELSFGNTTLTNTSGYANYFIVKYNSVGTPVWASSTGFQCTGHGITVDQDNNIFTTGFFYESATFGDTTFTNLGNDDVFVVKYDQTGTVLWAKTAGGAGGDNAYDITADNDGNIFLVGGFTGSSSFDNQTISSIGSSDIFIAKIENTSIPTSMAIWTGKDEEDILIFPNPSQGIFEIKAGETRIDKIVIRNSTGQTIFHSETGSFNIDISSQGQGLYLVELTVNGQRIRRKVIVN